MYIYICIYVYIYIDEYILIQTCICMYSIV